MTDKPYDEYAGDVMFRLNPSLTVRVAPRFGLPGYVEEYYSVSYKQLRELIADAWLAGMGHSIDLMRGDAE